ncbi:MAG: copper homeostasis protein CutC [Muribaculaceae bacterium]|nr:copper homeostasis protein CutC [Muribaculaceae bacterium]
MILEICCGDINSVIAAKKGGANRIELCTGLGEGGLTPSLGLIKAASTTGMPEINVLIRPRPGDFVYNKDEINLMCDDIEIAISNGATGIVTGVLTPDGDVDTVAMRKLMGSVKKASEKIGRKINVTFHRAFDVARDMEEALDAIINLGCDTLLTSGMAQTAEIGIPALKKIVGYSDGRLVVMAGSGVNPDNCLRIVKETGVNALHSSASKKTESVMRFRREEVMMGKTPGEEYHISGTAPEIVEKFLMKL